jgi:aerobic carbon-monoxide dehydrogenase medium subunit
VKPPPFAFAQPDSLATALDCLSSNEGAFPMSGGQSLVPLLNLRLARPSLVVDLSRVPGLSEISTDGDGVSIGAMTTHSRIEAHPWPSALSALPAAASKIGYRAIRNRGTMGGSLAHADPAAELPTLALALDASIELTSTVGTRTLTADEFFVGYYETARHRDELVTAVSFPVPGDLRTGFAEISRRTGDFAIALAAVATWTDNGEPRARVVLGGLDVRPRRVPDLERAATAGIDEMLSMTTPETLAASTAPTDDIHATAGFRLHLGAEMVRRAAAGLQVAA